MKDEIEGAVRERSLESVSADAVEVFFQIFPDAERFDRFQAFRRKIEDIDVGSMLCEVCAVSARSWSHFQDFHPFYVRKVSVNGLENRRGSGIDLGEVLFAGPKTVPYGLIGFSN